MAYREIREKLISLGCNFVRQGKGSHEIWVNPYGLKFPIPKRTIQGGLAKRILTQARDRRKQCPQ